MDAVVSRGFPCMQLLGLNDFSALRVAEVAGFICLLLVSGTSVQTQDTC